MQPQRYTRKRTLPWRLLTSLLVLLFTPLLSLAQPTPALAATPGTVVGWGYNDFGQLNIPAGLSGVTAIAAGERHSLALKSDGTAVAWGYNFYGQLNIPAGLNGVMAIAAGERHSLALKSDGTAVAWGANGFGQLNIPAGLNGVMAIAAGIYHSLALKSDGTVVAWGNNVLGQSTIPVGLNDVTAIAAGGYHSLALKGDGTVVAWGDNGFGQSTIPAGLSDVTAIAGGGYHSLALKSDSTVVAWGRNTYGQLNIPAGLNSVMAIAAGSYHSLALKSDGTVVAWGNNCCGQSTIPAELSGVTAIAAGDVHNLALVPSDTTAPVITPSIIGTLGSNGWYVSDVSVSWTVVDNESAISSQSGCDPVTVNSDTSGVTFPCAATSAGGSNSQSVTIQRDATAPTISAAAAPPPNAAGWYNSGVAVHFTCGDNLSGVTSCPADEVLSSEGAAVASTAQTVSDLAGNTSDPSNVVTVQLDKTAPVVAVSGVSNGASYTLGSVPTAGCDTSDALSGVATQATLTVSGGNGDGTGVFIATCDGATDLADNSGSASVSYTVTAAPPPLLRQQVESVRSTLAALLPSGDSKTDKSLQKALSKLDQALAANLWEADGDHLTLIGDDVFNRLYDVVQALAKIKNPAQAIPTASSTLVTISRVLAQIALDEAISGGGDAGKIAKAQSKLSKGDGEVAKGKLVKAIAQYEDAWEYAQQALGRNPVLAALDAADVEVADDEESDTATEPEEEEATEPATLRNVIFLPVVSR